MKYYYNKFLQYSFDKIKPENEEQYLFILWVCNEYINESGKLSDKIKDELSEGTFRSDLNKIKYLLSLKIQKQNSISNRQTQNVNKSKLKSVQIKNFKGFNDFNIECKGSKIDIHLNNTIIFAPNGGGKTSFCEALEYRLTNDIKEAKKRGFKDKLGDYFNDGNRKSIPPKIDITFDSEETQTENFNEIDCKNFETCFIEKNRIQEFALLGIDKREEKNVIATLFGLEDLEEFISSFVLPNSFKLNNLKKEEIKKELENLEKKNLTNLANKEQREKDIVDKKKEIESILGITFSQGEFDLKIVDLESDENSLALVIGEPSENVLINHIREDIEESLKQVKSIIDSYKNTCDFITERQTEVDYKALYEAIQGIQQMNPVIDLCPACDTPLSNVNTNPYEKASQNLAIDNIKEIALKQQLRDTQKDEIATKYFLIEQLIKDFKSNISILSSGFPKEQTDIIIEKITEFREILKLNPSDFDNKIKLIEETYTYFSSATIELSNYFLQIKTVYDSRKNIDSKKSDLEKLKAKKITLKKLKSDLEKLDLDLTSINKFLYNFSSEKCILDQKINIENEHNQFLDKVENCYKLFHRDLINFKAEEEKNKFDGVEGPATKYYQLINKFDSEVETIEKIVFHKENSGNYRIRVKFKNEIELIDAFKRLSEGHVRALGLSMMLAIAEKEDKPFLIFDDVVNAIDSDHRANIIEMIFTENVLKNKQLIITTHDRLFWERFCNYDNSNNKYLSYIFDCQEHIGMCHINYDGAFATKIDKALEVYDIRQALVYCRILFETIVTNYCLENNVEVSAKFSVRKKERNNLIKIDLERMYKLVKNHISGEFDFTATYNAIYGKNSTNWQGMNQENHSLDDNNLNFSHSKTSREVANIYENIKKLELILSPEKAKNKIEDIEKVLSVKKLKLEKIDVHLQNKGFQTNNPIRFGEIKIEKGLIENDVKKLEDEILVLNEYLPKQDVLA